MKKCGGNSFRWGCSMRFRTGRRLGREDQKVKKLSPNNCERPTSPASGTWRTSFLRTEPSAASGLRSGNALGDLSGDSKAHKLFDTIVILAAVQTTAAQSGDSSYQRTFQTASGITGLAGDINTKGLNPLFQRQFRTQLHRKGRDRFEYNLSNQPDRPGNRRAAQRQPGCRGAAQDFHEQPA
jgi:flagellar basal body L-ring protein FlgH